MMKKIENGALMKKITLKDIAAELNVTVGTVSHVLNGVGDISAVTRERVLETAKRMGYISNSGAVALRQGKTHTVAIIVPDISNPHIAWQIKLMEAKLKQHGYSVVILNTNEEEGEENQAIVTACGKRVDGILLCPVQTGTGNLDFLDRLEIPYILIGRSFPGRDVDYVTADDLEAGYLAGRYLLEKGCVWPLYVGAHSYIESSCHRFAGLQRAYAEGGIRLPEDRFLELSPEAGRAGSMIREGYAHFPTHDALVAFSDLMAFELLALGKDWGVPVIGFDAIGTHLPLPVSYASVGMVGDGWSEAAVSALLGKMNGKREPCRIRVAVELLEFGQGSTEK